MKFTIKGFSLIEIVIVIMMSFILIGSILSLFLIVKSSYHYILGLMYIQDTGKFASEYFQKEIRTAGYIGCMKLSSHRSVDLKNFFSADTALVGSIQSSAIYFNTVHKKPLSDAITVSKMSTHAVSVVSRMNNPYQLVVQSSPELKIGDKVIISNCRQANLFIIKHLERSRDGVSTILYSNIALPLYKEDALVGALQKNTYYLADTGRTTQRGNKIKALYLTDINGQSYELLAGIDKMVIRYVENTPLLMTKYFSQPASAVVDWKKVIAVHIAFLLTHPEAILATDYKFSFLGQTYSKNDGQIYKQWQVWIGLRER